MQRMPSAVPYQIVNMQRSTLQLLSSGLQRRFLCLRMSQQLLLISKLGNAFLRSQIRYKRTCALYTRIGRSVLKRNCTTDMFRMLPNLNPFGKPSMLRDLTSVRLDAKNYFRLYSTHWLRQIRKPEFLIYLCFHFTETEMCTLQLRHVFVPLPSKALY